MHIKQFENKITSELKWNTISDIPDFPLIDFKDTKLQIEEDKFTVGIDFSTANEFAQWLYGKGHRFFFLILATVSVIVAISSLVLAIVLSNYWLLFGIAIGFAGQFLSNPYNPLKTYLKPIVGVLFLVFVYGLWKGMETMTFLSSSFILPFFINSFLYNMNQNKLRAVAMDSEKIFIFLYQNGKLGLKDNTNGKRYWHFEV
jgi:hypothetical protein